MSWSSRSPASCLARSAAIPTCAQSESLTGDRENPEYNEALDRPLCPALKGGRPDRGRLLGRFLSGTDAGEIATGTELAEQLHQLLAVLEPVTAQLRDLVHAGYEANWFCFIASHATEHAGELDRQTMRRLLALPGDLWLDACGDGFDHED